MAKSKSGDGFNVDFSDMFESEPLIKEEPVVNISNTTNTTNISNTDVIEKSAPKKSIKTKDDPALPYTIYLLSEDDRLFLQFRAQGKHMTMTDFLWNLIDKNIKQTKEIDVTDDIHKKFRNVNLAANTSVKATMKQRDSLLEPAARHRLKITRYIAYVVHEAMLNDKDWQ